MNALELAEECQDGYPLAPDAIAAAALLRRQHEAIVKLREALLVIQNKAGGTSTMAYRVAEKALADTEEIEK